jgi:hypothetical protein
MSVHREEPHALSRFVAIENGGPAQYRLEPRRRGAIVTRLAPELDDKQQPERASGRVPELL